MYFCPLCHNRLWKFGKSVQKRENPGGGLFFLSVLVIMGMVSGPSEKLRKKFNYVIDCS